MRIGELLTRTPLEEMSYSRKKAEAVITGLEKPVNDHLLKLLVVDPADRIMFDEPFGGAETENITRRVRRIARQGYAVRGDADLGNVAESLRSFHEDFAEACAQGVSTEQIETMIRRFATPA